MLILQRWGDGPNEVEQAVAARRDMRAVLKVVGRPIALSRCVVTFVKQHIKSVKNEGFVFFRVQEEQLCFPPISTVPAYTADFILY
jgi:hypothetical protein